jgi:hypothetical protein
LGEDSLSHVVVIVVVIWVTVTWEKIEGQ